MKINGYTLTYDPEGLETAHNPDYKEMLVPFDDYIIFDMGTVRTEESFSLVLRSNEIKDVTDMLMSSRLIYIEFGDYDGLFYVTNFDKTWVKYMSNHKITTYKVDGFYLGSHIYFKLNYADNYQKTDFNLEEKSLVCIPENYISKCTATATYERTNGTNGHVWVFSAPSTPITFKADKYILVNGSMRYYLDAVQKYGFAPITSNIKIDNNIFFVTAPLNDANKICTIYDSSSNSYCDLADGLNSLTNPDIKLKTHPFNPTLTLNHTDIMFSLNQNFIEIQSGTVVRHTQKRFAIPAFSSSTYGDKVRTTANPQTFILDRSIGGTLPTTLQYAESPGFVHWDVGGVRTFSTFTDVMATHPNDGFNPNTRRNYMLFLPKVPTYSLNSEWSLTGAWSSMNDGANYEGIASYVYTSAAGAYAQVIKNLPYTGKYDVYVMARNNADSNMTFKLYLNTVDKGLVTFTHGGTSTPDDHYAYTVYLGNHSLSSGNNTFKITRESGTLALFYLMIIPTAVTNEDCMGSNIASALNDTRMSYEVI